MVAEKNSVCRRGGKPADPLDLGDEAHVEHAVGLVDDEDFDAGEQDPAALELVEQTAGRGDQHVDAAIELLVLVVEGDAADDQRHRSLWFLPYFSKFSWTCAASSRVGSRMSVRACGHGRGPLEQRQHRQDERGRLTGAGLRNAQHVAAARARGGITCSWMGVGVV